MCAYVSPISFLDIYIVLDITISISKSAGIDVSWCFTHFAVLERHKNWTVSIVFWWNYANQKETSLHPPMVHVNVIEHFKSFPVGKCFESFVFTFYQNTIATNNWNVASVSPSPTAVVFFTPGGSCRTGAVHFSEASVLWWHSER